MDTCKICRCWTRPLPKAVAASRLATEFNKAVQWDILFYKDVMISHIIDEAIRFTVASILPDKRIRVPSLAFEPSAAIGSGISDRPN